MTWVVWRQHRNQAYLAAAALAAFAVLLLITGREMASVPGRPHQLLRQP